MEGFLIYISNNCEMAFNKNAMLIMGNPEYVQLFYEPVEKKVAIVPAKQIDTTIFNILESHLPIKSLQGLSYVEAFQFFKDFHITMQEGGHRALWSKDAQMLAFNIDQFHYRPRRRINYAKKAEK